MEEELGTYSDFQTTISTSISLGPSAIRPATVGRLALIPSAVLQNVTNNYCLVLMV